MRPPNRHQEVMLQRRTTLDERCSSGADPFPSWERLSKEPKLPGTVMLSTFAPLRVNSAKGLSPGAEMLRCSLRFAQDKAQHDKTVPYCRALASRERSPHCQPNHSMV